MLPGGIRPVTAHGDTVNVVMLDGSASNLKLDPFFKGGIGGNKIPYYIAVDKSASTTIPL